jgi:hypothetical protein
MPVQRAQLITEQGIRFRAAAKRIDAALRNGSTNTAKANIKKLMEYLVENWSEQTVEMFREIHSRWRFLADQYRYLQRYLEHWGTPEEEIEMLRCWNEDSPWIFALISTFQEQVEWIEALPDGISREPLARELVALVIDSGEYQSFIGADLIRITAHLYNYAFNVRHYAHKLHEARSAGRR